MKLRRRQSSNGRCRHVATPEDQSGSTEPSGRATMKRKRGDVKHTGIQVPIGRPRRCIRGGGGCSASERHRGRRWKRSPVTDDVCACEVLFNSINSRKRPLRPRKRQSTILSPAVHHPHRHRAGGVRKGHDSLLEESRRQAGRAPTRVLATLLAVEPHCNREKTPAGLRGHDSEEAHHRRDGVTVAAAVGGGQPRGEAV